MTISELRKLYNMSQAEFSRRFSLSVRTLQQWEQGKSQPPCALLNAIYEIYVREHEQYIYEILFKNQVVDEVVISQGRKNVLLVKKTRKRLIQPFAKDNITIFDFYNFLKDRCYEDGRADLDEILAQANMTSNNPYEWIKVSHGVTWEDYFWIRMKNEGITWEEVRVRE